MSTDSMMDSRTRPISCLRLEESGGVDMAVERGASANLVFPDDLVGAAPADEVGFNGVAVPVGADGATTGMAREIRRDAMGGGHRRREELRTRSVVQVVPPWYTPAT